jgi:hypothetical protein
MRVRGALVLVLILLLLFTPTVVTSFVAGMASEAKHTMCGTAR